MTTKKTKTRNKRSTKKKRKKWRYFGDRHISSKVRRAVRKRDQGRCVYCHKKGRRNYLLLKGTKIEYGHVIPFSKGGDNCVKNIQLECFKCNRRKGATVVKIPMIKKWMGAGAKGCKLHRNKKK